MDIVQKGCGSARPELKRAFQPLRPTRLWYRSAALVLDDRPVPPLSVQCCRARKMLSFKSSSQTRFSRCCKELVRSLIDVVLLVVGVPGDRKCPGSKRDRLGATTNER